MICEGSWRTGKLLVLCGDFIFLIVPDTTLPFFVEPQLHHSKPRDPQILAALPRCEVTTACRFLFIACPWQSSLCQTFLMITLQQTFFCRLMSLQPFVSRQYIVPFLANPLRVRFRCLMNRILFCMCINRNTGKQVLAHSQFSSLPALPKLVVLTIHTRKQYKKHPTVQHQPSYLPTTSYKPWHDHAAHMDANHGVHGRDPLVQTKGCCHGCIVPCISGGVQVEIKYQLVYQ